MIPIKDYSFSMRGSTDPKKSIMYKTDGININPFIIRKAIVGPDYTEPFYVEDISGSENILKIKDKTNQPVRNTIEYSFDKKTWLILGTTSNTEISMTIPSNTRVYLRSIANTWSKNDGLGCPLTCTGNYNVGGNIMSMLYGSNFTGEELVFPPNTDRNFRNFLFCDKLVNANDLLLPATTLTPYCYYALFSGCTSLTSAPELPAMTLANSCYAWMFNNCSSLTTAPELPATTLVSGSYNSIFKNCTSLNYIKVGFTEWPDVSSSISMATYTWTQLSVNTTGTFVCPAALPQYFNASGNNTHSYSSISGYTNAIPYGWTVETY